MSLVSKAIVGLPCLQINARFYAALAYNSPKNGKATDQRKEGSEGVKREEKQPESVISHVSPGINNASSWLSHPSVSDPTFQVISPGSLGALLLVKLPPKSEIYAASGTAIAVSSKVTVERTVDGNFVIALGRKMAGGQLIYHKFTTESLPGDILITPGSLSDIAAISMDGRSEYYVRKGAFLAKGPRVTLGISGGALRSFGYRVTGRGTLVITNYGAIHRLILNAGDEYLVNPKHLIAWDALTHPSISLPLIKSSPSRGRKIIENVASRASERMPTVIENFRNSPSVKPTLEKMKRISVRTRKWIYGGPELLKLTGPGDFYLASRVEPVFGSFKTLTSPSIEEIEETQIPLTPPSTTPRARQPPEPPRMSYALVTKNGHVTFTDELVTTLSSTPLSPPSPDKPSIIGRIASGSGLLQLRRWILPNRIAFKDTKRE
ncbi:12648_t:CDS:2 [Ambispora gerdemannii]|uniref:Altered inheritance of mitochondria protein 24, mitochondrial n=1 Tax=Ambispora gerdemannii TaxID=144530 RepID=A0A9N9AN93_9GLOM|nr:12648_t:CDS:2 [Ambispora gerdemannii]